MLQKLRASGALPFGCGIGKMHADIAQRQRAQNGIRHGVKQNVGIRVPGQSEVAGNLHTCQNQRAPRFDTMRVPALTDAKRRLHQRGSSSVALSRLRYKRASSMSLGLVILILRSVPSTTETSTCSSRSTSDDSSVPTKRSLRARS